MAVCSMLCADGLLLHLVGKRQLLVYSGASYGNGKLGDSIWESHHKSSPQGAHRANTPPNCICKLFSAGSCCPHTRLCVLYFFSRVQNRTIVMVGRGTGLGVEGGARPLVYGHSNISLGDPKWSQLHHNLSFTPQPAPSEPKLSAAQATGSVDAQAHPLML